MKAPVTTEGANAAPARMPVTGAGADLHPGSRLDGRFLIRETVTRGGMANIYRAEDEAHGRRTVAIKIPHLGFESDPAWFVRFQQEQEIGLKLNHPSLLRILPGPESRSRPYLVMEFLSGRTLARVLAETRLLTEERALAIASAVGGALQAMHEGGFVHRDLKPGNIMLEEDGSVRILDYGMASAPLRTRSLFAKMGSTFGSPEYMSPEEVANGAIDERSDLYSLGAVLYEMLTGEVPFRREDPWESAFARLSGDPVAPRRLNPALTPEAEEIVLHALQRRPDDRYQTIAALRRDLDSPRDVQVTGYCERLQPPRWRLSLQGTPILTGLLLGFGVLLGLFALFWILRLTLR